MIIEYIRYRIEPDHAAAFEEAYREASAPLAESDHCIDFELSHCVEEPERYILRIRWDSLDGHSPGSGAARSSGASWSTSGPTSP